MATVDPVFNFSAKKRFIFAIDISDPDTLRDVLKIAQECRAIVVKSFDRGRFPDALISDAQHAPYLQHQPVEEKMKYLQFLPLIAKDAVRHGVPVLYAESFIRAWKDHLQTKIPVRRNEKRPLPNSQKMTSSSAPAKKNENAIPLRLTPNDVVIRDVDPQYGVLFKHMKEFPVMHLGSDYGISFFHRAPPDLEAKRKAEIDREECPDFHYQNVTEVPFKEYGPPKPRKSANTFCEICKTSISDLPSHLQSSEHVEKISVPGFYDELDEVLKDWNAPVFDPYKTVEKDDPDDWKQQAHPEFEELKFPEDKDIFDDTPPAEDKENVAQELGTKNNNNEDSELVKSEKNYPRFP